jgi:hypothetical protein
MCRTGFPKHLADAVRHTHGVAAMEHVPVRETFQGQGACSSDVNSSLPCGQNMQICRLPVDFFQLVRL